MQINKPKRWKFWILLSLSLLFFTEVVYAVTDNVNVSETINLKQFVFGGDTKLFSNTINLIRYTFSGDTSSLSNTVKLSQFLFSGDTLYPSLASKANNPLGSYNIGLCGNSTKLSFNNCAIKIKFTLQGNGGLQNINLASSCGISPSSVLGDGNPKTLTVIKPACVINASAPSGYGFSIAGQNNGVIQIASSTNWELIQVCASCTSSGNYYLKSGSGSSSTQTQTVIVFQTVFVTANAGACTNSADCGANQLGAFIGSLLPSLIIILISLFAVHEIGGDNIDGRIYILTFMFAISADGFLSALGAFGIYGIPWYIPIFVDIIGLVILLGNRASSSQV